MRYETECSVLNEERPELGRKWEKYKRIIKRGKRYWG
jgi:hypothetical protein